jgi:hypothetical protein
LQQLDSKVLLGDKDNTNQWKMNPLPFFISAGLYKSIFAALTLSSCNGIAVRLSPETIIRQGVQMNAAKRKTGLF